MPGGPQAIERARRLGLAYEIAERIQRHYGETYEWIGKIRNARAAGNSACLPYLAVELTRTGMCLIGLANRHLYAASSTAFEESLRQPGRPEGYDRLCHMVMSGDLADTQRVTDAAETFWSGVEKWADERGITIEDELEALLDRQSE